MPLIAASTCSHIPSSRHKGPISGVGSNAIDDVVPWVAQTKNGTSPADAVGGDRLGQRIRAHRERLVVGHQPQPVGADPGDAQSLLDARVGLFRRVADQAARVAVGVDGARRGPPPRRADRDEDRLARRPLDHAAPAGARRGERLGKAEQLHHPVEHQRLQLGARGRRHPAHPLHAQAGREQLTEDRRIGRVRREVGEEARVLPVDDARDDDPLEIGAHRLPALGVGGRRGRQGGPYRAGLQVRAHRVALDPLDVVSDPVDQLVAGAAELLGRHGGAHYARPARR